MEYLYYNLNFTARFVEDDPKYFLRMKELQVTQQLLDAVSDHISHQYPQLGLELGLAFAKILQFRMNNRNNTMKIVREILGEWLNTHEPCNSASLERLEVALLRSGCSVQPLIDFVDQTLVAKATQDADGERTLDRQTSLKCVLS